jgi:thiol-disulfide isomerase/thioredoxin
MNSGSKYILIAIAVVVGAAALILSLRIRNSPGPESTSTETAPAPATTPPSLYLTLSDLKGNTIAMDTSKLIFMNVWATWCGPCNAEMPSIEALYERYKNNPKIEFYVVSDEDPTTVRSFLTKKDYELPFYLYSGVYPEALNGNAIPRTYMVRNGKVLAEQIGAVNWNDPQVFAFIDQQLAM